FVVPIEQHNNISRAEEFVECPAVACGERGERLEQRFVKRLIRQPARHREQDRDPSIGITCEILPTKSQRGKLRPGRFARPGTSKKHKTSANLILELLINREFDFGAYERFECDKKPLNIAGARALRRKDKPRKTAGGPSGEPSERLQLR